VKRVGAIAAFLLLAALIAWWFLPGDETPPRAVVAVAEEVQKPIERPGPVPVVTGASVQGRVLRRGSPVSGARVTLRAGDIRTVLSNGEGAFSLEGIAPGEAWLSAALDEEASPLLGPLILAPGEARTGLSLELQVSAAVAGRVVDSQSRAAIPGARVVSSGGQATTDHDGRFSLHALPPGQTWIQTSAAGHLSRLEWLSLESARAHTGLEISLDPASALSGTVSQQGKRVTGAAVWVEHLVGSRVGTTLDPVLSGAQGTWRLELSPGVWRVMGQLPDGTRIRGPHVRIDAGEDRKGIELEAGESLGADGVVRLDGAVLPEATLTLFETRSSEATAVTTTGPDGRFHFTRVPVGWYLMQVRRGALTVQTGPFEQTGEGQGWTVDLTRGSVLSGHVEPRAIGVLVRWRSGDWAGEAAFTRTDASGAFRFEGVGSGVLLVEAEGEQGSAAARTNAGTTDLVLTLARGRLKVTVQDDHGAAVSDFALTLIPQSGGLVRRFPVLSPTGVFALDLPMGTWRVEASAAGYADGAPATVEVRNGEAEVRLQLNSAVPVRGMVRDAVSRLPVRGAGISISRLGGPSGQQFRILDRTSAGLTDGNGEFYVPSVALPATVEVRHPLYKTAWQQLAPARDGVLRLEVLLEPGKPPPDSDRLLEYEGIGAQLQGDRERVWITQVYENSPAEGAGLQSGDVIVLVDGRPSALPVENTVRQILGPAGSVVKLTIRRGPETLEFSVRRRAITL
jgi:hypothetical protein